MILDHGIEKIRMNHNILIERVSLAELTKIMAIEERCFGVDAFSRRQMLYLITIAKGIFLVAKHNNEVAGYISLITSKRHNTGRIYSIAVSPQHRGSGMGGMLLDKAIEFARKKGLRAVFLEVRTDNNAAISLYEKKGFVQRLYKHRYYEDGSDAYSMVLSLTKDYSFI